MTRSNPTLERWIQFHDCVVGYIFGAKDVRDGQRIKTSHVSLFLPDRVRCGDGEEYLLGEPGTVEEHNRPLPDGVWKRKGGFFNKLRSWS